MSTQRPSTLAARESDPATPPDAGRERLLDSTGFFIPALLLFASGAAAADHQAGPLLLYALLELCVAVTLARDQAGPEHQTSSVEAHMKTKHIKVRKAIMILVGLLAAMAIMPWSNGWARARRKPPATPKVWRLGRRLPQSSSTPVVSIVIN